MAVFVDWPSQKSKAMELVQAAVRATTEASAPLIHSVSRFTVQEGHRAVLVHPDGSSTNMDLSRHEATGTVTLDEVLSGSGISKLVRDLGNQLGQQMERDIVEGIQKLPPEIVGRFGGRTPEELGQNLLETLRRMNVDFDDDGQPTFSFLINPKSSALLKAMESDADVTREFESILEEKKHEWLRRENSRRLVD